MKAPSVNWDPIRRLLLWLGAIALGFTLICGLGMSALMCGFSMMVSRDDVAVIVSPDKRFRAILVETNGGATTSFGYIVCIEPIGFLTSRHQVANLYGAGRSEQAYGANLVWAGARTLRIEYLDARIAELDDPDPVIAGERFSVQLKSGVNDESAPPGGMLYNLQGRPHG